MDRLTPAVVQEAAQQYFNRERYARFVLYPRDYYAELEAD